MLMIMGWFACDFGDSELLFFCDVDDSGLVRLWCWRFRIGVVVMLVISDWSFF